MENRLNGTKIAVIIPAYNVEKHILEVISTLPSYISFIIVIDDASTDRTYEIVANLARKDERIRLIKHHLNQGVGGAMVSGFKKALELDADICVKMDGDGQMDPSYLPNLVNPLINGEADYTKGNRFRDFSALKSMPTLRRFGNLVLSFLVKAATGYWNIFDPTNGFIAIRKEVLLELPMENIEKTYFFETSMLANLYLINAKITDIPIPARYGNEQSNLKISRVVIEFPPKLIGILIRRILLKYFLFDFSIASVYLAIGLPLFVFGFIFGIINWIRFSSLGVPAPTGTVMLATLSVIIGIQFLLSFIQFDIGSIPQKPRTKKI
ncbi:MAG: glycosyltransferase family 2 protein [Thermanaerothrix sp.]|uniref:glycosyltransferase family 2 protein n=1 Tax=Thermanaerothrix sp. TaxID=2972675 RepID=UPI003C7CE9EC